MEQKPKQGRPTKDPERHKRGRSISMTNEEYARLGELAKAANRGISEYVVERLGLVDILPGLKTRGFPSALDAPSGT